MTEDPKKRRVVIWEVGRMADVPSAPERAVEKVMRLFGWENCEIHSAVAAGRDDHAASLVLFSLTRDASRREQGYRELWQFLAEQSVEHVRVIDFEVSHASSTDGAFLSRLAATPAVQNGTVDQPILTTYGPFLTDVARGELFRQSAASSHLGTWVKAAKELTGGNEQEFLTNLSCLASECQKGMFIADHGPDVGMFVEDGVSIFSSWLALLDTERRWSLTHTRPKKRYCVWVVDDQIEKAQKQYLPAWLWRHTDFDYLFLSPESAASHIDSLSSIPMTRGDVTKSKGIQYPDLIVLDLDLKHMRSASALPDTRLDDYLVRFPEQMRNLSLRSYGLFLIAQRDIDGIKSQLAQMESQYAALSDRLDAQLKASPGVETVKALCREQCGIDVQREQLKKALRSLQEKDVPKLLSDCGVTSIEQMAEVRCRYYGDATDRNHREGIVLYHYLKAFDEELPIVILTAEETDAEKLRQTSGVRTAFVSKQDLVRRPGLLLDTLRGLAPETPHALAPRRDYPAAKKLCADLLDASERLIPVGDDPLVEKTKTRVFAGLLTTRTAKPYFARNFEMSQPTGSMCAERSAIAQAIAEFKDIGKDEFVRLAVLGDKENAQRTNPVGPCGVCSEWVRKLKKCEVIMFSKDMKHFCYLPRDTTIAY